MVTLAVRPSLGADGLSPVTLKPALGHPPIVLVEDGQPKATIALMVEVQDRSRNMNQAVMWLQQFIEKATGAKLPIVQPKGGVMPQVEGSAIMIGDCEAAAANGLVDHRARPVERISASVVPDHGELVFLGGADRLPAKLEVNLCEVRAFGRLDLGGQYRFGEQHEKQEHYCNMHSKHLPAAPFILNQRAGGE